MECGDSTYRCTPWVTIIALFDHTHLSFVLRVRPSFRHTVFKEGISESYHAGSTCGHALAGKESNRPLGFLSRLSHEYARIRYATGTARPTHTNVYAVNQGWQVRQTASERSSRCVTTLIRASFLATDGRIRLSIRVGLLRRPGRFLVMDVRSKRHAVLGVVDSSSMPAAAAVVK